MSAGGAEREGDTVSESRLQTLSCQHRAQHGARTHKLWDHDLSQSWHLTNWATQAPHCLSVFFFFNFFFQRLFLFLGQRETEHERGRGRERGRHRIRNRLQAPSRQPRAWRGARTHGPRDRDLAEVGRLTDCATQAPQGTCSFFTSKFLSFSLKAKFSAMQLFTEQIFESEDDSGS